MNPHPLKTGNIMKYTDIYGDESRYCAACHKEFSKYVKYARSEWYVVQYTTLTVAEIM
jgi:hypothetical protein